MVKNLLYLPAFLLGLDSQAVFILAALMLFDVITGVMRTYIVHGGHSIKSYRLAAGILSKVLILSVPLVLVWGGKGAGINFLPIAQGTLTVLVLAEVYSILGNIQSARLGKDVMEFDAVNFIIIRLRDWLEDMVVKDKHSNK